MSEGGSVIKRMETRNFARIMSEVNMIVVKKVT